MSTAAGIFFYARTTERFLFLLRTDNKSNTWGLPGGTMETDETLLQGLERECTEELGFFPNNGKLIPIQKFINNNFIYHTFFCEVDNEFIPTLNKEHCGYAWVIYNNYPKPLHPGLFNTVNFDIVQDKIKALIKKGA